MSVESVRSILMVLVHRADFLGMTVNSVSLPASTTAAPSGQHAKDLGSIWQVWPQLSQTLHFPVDQAGISQGTVPNVPPEYVAPASPYLTQGTAIQTPRPRRPR